MSLSREGLLLGAGGCAIALAVGLGACSSADEIGFERAIGPAHANESKLAAAKLFASSAERFGFTLPGAANTSAFTYATPQGWSELPLTEMRAVRLQVGEAAGDECTVTVLGGDGGGALANVNRWCGQIKVKAWGQAQLDAAPHIEMFGSPALVVALGDENSERMVLGALAQSDGRAVFVKLIGARALVAAQRAAFEAFCISLAKKN